MTLPNSLSLTKKDSKEISQISSWKFHKAPGTERSQGLWHYCFNQEPNHYVSYSYVQLQWRKKRVKEGKKITQSEKGSQGEMEEERKSRVENGFKAKKGGGITPLSKLPETFKDEGIKLMVPSSVSSRKKVSVLRVGSQMETILFSNFIILSNNTGGNPDQEGNSIC